MITIAIDAMGGDFAPQATIQGVNRALEVFDDVCFQLFGDQEQILKYVSGDSSRIEIIHTSEKITGEDEPVKAIRQKKQASMVLAAQAVKDGKADALLSAGNTGALLASGLLIVGRIKHIDRPGLMPILPTINPDSPQFILMDAGANAQCKVIHLHQFAILASFYANQVLRIAQPRVGLLNNGTEAGKGNDLSKEAYECLVQEPAIHFVGNIEAKSLLTGEVDIVITDGFTGNAVLKTLEGTTKSVFSVIKRALTESGLKTKLGALLIKDALGQLKDEFDDTKAGGAILLGVKAPVIKAHGSSNEEAIFNAIRQAREVVKSNIVEHASKFFEESEKNN